MKKLILQFLKFAVVGGLAFLIDTGIYVGLTALFGDAWHLLFNVISFCVSVVFNYVCSMRFVFKGRQDMSRTTQMVIFVILSVIGLGINELIVWALIDRAGLGSWLTRIFVDEVAAALAGVVAKIAATAVVLVWNFISRKIFLEEHRAK